MTVCYHPLGSPPKGFGEGVSYSRQRSLAYARTRTHARAGMDTDGWETYAEDETFRYERQRAPLRVRAVFKQPPTLTNGQPWTGTIRCPDPYDQPSWDEQRQVLDSQP